MPVKIKGSVFTDDQLQALIDQGLLGTGQKNNPASSTPSGTPLNGPYSANENQFGVFSAPGVRPDRFSALEHPLTFATLLPLIKSEYFNELLEIVTGQTQDSGTNATGFCGDPPSPGQLKTMQMNFVFGKAYFKTQLNAIGEVGRLRNRADMPGRILNSGPFNNPFIPDVMGRLDDSRSVLQNELYTAGTAMRRHWERVAITGTPAKASTAAETFFIKEFLGLDGLIKTGYTDNVTGVAAPAADSAVISFNTTVGGTIGGGDGRNIVQALTELIYSRWEIADRVGMEGFRYALVMPKEFFRSLTEVWACQYNLFKCSSSNAGQPLPQPASELNQLRLEMFNGSFLWVDGIQVPVVFSDGIPLNRSAANTYTISIYFVPLYGQGAPLTYFQYFDMSNQYQQEWASHVMPQQTSVLNNGLYRVGLRSTGLCTEYHFQSMQRLIMETPFLAGRIDNISFTYTAPTRRADPRDTWAYVDGGVTYRS